MKTIATETRNHKEELDYMRMKYEILRVKEVLTTMDLRDAKKAYNKIQKIVWGFLGALDISTMMFEVLFAYLFIGELPLAMTLSTSAVLVIINTFGYAICKVAYNQMVARTYNRLSYTQSRVTEVSEIYNQLEALVESEEKR